MNNQALLAINERLEIVRKKIESGYSDEPMLYHYTTYDALFNNRGILREKERFPWFRFSRFDRLNDISEGDVLIDCYKEQIHKLKEGNAISAEFYDLIKDLNYGGKYLFFEHPKGSASIPDEGVLVDSIPYVCEGKAYICCFTAKSDSLPMWNYFCKDGKYEAFNIGVKIDRVFNRYSSYRNGYIYDFYKVIYDDSRINHMLESIIMGAYEAFVKLGDSANERDLSYIKSTVSSFLNTYRFVFKKDCFSHEEEYRAVIVIPDETIGSTDIHDIFPIRYRNKNNMIIPYIEKRLEESSVCALNFGPMDIDDENKGEQIRIMRELLDNRGWNSIKDIGYSDIPVRY